MGLSEFEKRRQQNIQRNQELFKKLNLDTLSSDFHRSIGETKNGVEKPKKRKTRKSTRKKKELRPEHPLRRSARLAGIKAESTDDNKLQEQLEKQRKEKEEEERLKSIRLSGDLMLTDVLNSKGKAGEDAKETLDRLSRLGKSFSMGDFFEAVKSRKQGSKQGKQLREEFDSMKLYERFHPNDINLTSQRMTYVMFHPTVDRKIVMGGDTNGLMGIWSLEDDTEEDGPAITQFKFHGKNIPKLIVRPEMPGEVVSCSYDGSIRVLDIEKKISQSVVEFDDQWGDASGISDTNFIDKNVCYFTTLGGEFAQFDLREKSKIDRNALNVLRLHDKKIGGFAVNPSFNQQIATASLDRTMRIWDLRTVKESQWSEFENAKSPHCMGAYHSRLSVSIADWNLSNDVVCNSYDNTIRIFQLGNQITDDPGYIFKPKLEDSPEGLESIPINLKPTNTLKHNCQTGRWVSILKARWQQNSRDGVEKFVIGNMNRFFDVFDRDGTQLAHLGDDYMTSVPAVASFHRTENWIVGGNASGKVFLFS